MKRKGKFVDMINKEKLKGVDPRSKHKITIKVRREPYIEFLGQFSLEEQKQLKKWGFKRKL